MDDLKPARMARLGVGRLGVMRLDFTLENVVAHVNALEAQVQALSARLDAYDRQLADLRPQRQTRVRTLNDKKRTERASFVAAVDAFLETMVEPDVAEAVKLHLAADYTRRHPKKNWTVQCKADERRKQTKNAVERYRREKRDPSS